MRATPYVLKLTALLVLACATVAPTASAHTFHTSLMRVEYNSREQLVEISLQVFAHDLEKVLSRRNGRRVRLDMKDADKLVIAYLRDAFGLKNRDGRVKELLWVGMEAKADAVLLYVEAKMPEGLHGAQVRNCIFFDLLDDQVNLVQVRHDGKNVGLVFKPGDGFRNILPPQSGS